MAVNEVMIKLNPYEQINEITINGKTIASYSELNNFVKAPFLQWAYRFFGAVERELNDQFTLTVIGEDFETKFLEDMSKCVKSCIRCRRGQFPIDMEYDERIEEFSNLCSMYGEEISYQKEQIDMIVDSSISMQELQIIFDKYQGFSSFRGGATYVTPLMEIKCHILQEIRDSRRKIKLFLAENMQNAQQLSRNIPKTKEQNIILVFSEQPGVLWRDNCYYWGIKKNNLCRALELFLTHKLVFPQFVEQLNRQKLNINEMDEEDSDIYRIIDKVNPVVVANPVPILEKEETYQIKVSCIPDDVSKPQVIVKSEDERIVSCQGTMLKALNAGNTYIDLFLVGNIIPFQRLPVKVESHNYASSLKIISPISTMAVGQVQRLKVQATPEDADDINQYKWTSSDTEIATVNNRGEVEARKSGSVEIKVFGVKTETKIIINIKKKMNQIVLSMTDAKIFMGDRKKVEVKTEPEGCFDNSYTWESTDPSVAIVERKSDGDWIQSIGIGDCILTCKSKDGAVQASCRAFIQSSFYRKKKINWMLYMAWVFTFIAILNAFLPSEIPSKIIMIGISIAISGLAMIIKPEEKSGPIFLIILSLISIAVGILMMYVG